MSYYQLSFSIEMIWLTTNSTWCKNSKSNWSQGGVGWGWRGGGGNKWLNGGNTMLQEEMTQPIPKWNSEWIVLAFSCQWQILAPDKVCLYFHCLFLPDGKNSPKTLVWLVTRVHVTMVTELRRKLTLRTSHEPTTYCHLATKVTILIFYLKIFEAIFYHFTLITRQHH